MENFKTKQDIKFQKYFIKLLFVILIIFNLGSCNENKTEEKIEFKKYDIDNIFTSVNLLDSTIYYSSTKINLNSFIYKIFDGVFSKKIGALNSDKLKFTNQQAPISNNEIKNNLSILKIDTNNIQLFAETNIKNLMQFIKFKEKWELDAGKLIFNKQVYYFSPIIKNVSSNSTLKDVEIFSILSANDTSNNFEPIAKNIAYMIDLKTDTLKAEYYNFINDLYKIVELKKVETYDFFEYSINNTKVKQDNESTLRYFGKKIDSTLVENPNTGKLDTVITKYNLEPKSISKIIFWENWDYNFKSNSFRKKVIAICPVNVYIDPESGVEKQVAIGVIFLNN